MADSERSQQSGTTMKQGNGHNGDTTRKTVVRAATIAAASGATALAAKKVMDRDSGKESTERKSSGGSGDSSVMTSMVGSAWDSARDSLGPMMEDAAESAGEYLARSAPEVIRETLVPAFITGFERASKKSQED